MKLLTCPLNGPRNITEFDYGGEYHPLPSAESCDLKNWVEYVYFHENPAGIVLEWWCHTATSYWFLAERDTVSDTVLRTFPLAELTPERMRIATDENGKK